MSFVKQKRRRLNPCPPARDYVYMSTRSKNCGSDQPDMSEGSKEKAIWLDDDVHALVLFLKTRKSEAGDRANFNAAVWTAAAVEMEHHTSRGGRKTANSCKTKWGGLRKTYQVVDSLMKQSGMSWTPDKGVGVDGTSPPELQVVWSDYLEKHPTASPFANKGWPHYDDLHELMPGVAGGKYAFQGSSAVLTTSTDTGPLFEDAPDGLERSRVSVGRSGHGSGNEGDDGLVGDDEGRPTPPPSSPTIASKRRFSAIDSENISTPASSDIAAPSARVTPMPRSVSSTTSSSSKRGRMTGAIALANIGHSLADFTAIYRESIDRQTARHQHRAERREDQSNSMATAVEKVQEKETDLKPEELAALIDLFEREQDSARAYLLIRHDDIRKAWIRRKLASMSTPPAPL